MSLLWNWGSRNLLRRYTASTPSPPWSRHNSMVSDVVFPKTFSTLSSSSRPNIISSPTTTSLSSSLSSSYYLMTPLRFKSGVKTNSGCKKRFRVRGSGSIKRPRAGKSHNTGYLRRQRSNRLGHSTGIEGKKMEQRVRKLLGVFNA
mmetsp:Transcript_7624/g.16449  ORF Transcript_7624/g.16449 Transcript_7624/m.16449 type:complete len:146 (-) Transcript_7624:40-477(-)